jgi:hypothetical protein
VGGQRWRAGTNLSPARSTAVAPAPRYLIDRAEAELDRASRGRLFDPSRAHKEIHWKRRLSHEESDALFGVGPERAIESIAPSPVQA